MIGKVAGHELGNESSISNTEYFLLSAVRSRSI